MSHVKGYLYDGVKLTRTVILVGDITKALAHLREQYACQGWKEIVSELDATATVLEHFAFMLVEDDSGGSLVAYSLEEPWFSTERMLCEEFIVGGAKLESVVNALNAVAKLYGAARLILGTRAVRDAKHIPLARLYEQTGCKVTTVELSREVQ